MITAKKCNVTLMVTDMDASLKFYTTLLGFTLKARYGNHFAELDGPGISVALHPTDSAKIKIGNNVQIAIGVENIDAATQHLEQNEVPVRRQDETRVKIGVFQDPDGNTLYLAQ